MNTPDAASLFARWTKADVAAIEATHKARILISDAALQQAAAVARQKADEAYRVYFRFCFGEDPA